MGRNADTTIKVHIGENNSMKLQLKFEMFGILVESRSLNLIMTQVSYRGSISASAS